MSDAGLFIGWGEVVRGRETDAVETFGELLAYFGGLADAGTIESVEPVLLEPHGGELHGFFFVRGEAEALAALRVDLDFAAMIMRAELVVENVGVVAASTGGRLEALMERYSERVAALV